MRSSQAGRASPGRGCAASLALAVTFAAGAGLAAWVVGRLVSDRWLWSQWLLWVPTPVALLGAVAGWLAAWLPGLRRGAPRRRRRFLLWTLVVLALMSYFSLVEHRLLEAAPGAAPPPESLRFVHWNLDPHKYRPIQPDARPVIAMAGDVTVLTHGVEVLADPRMLSWLQPGMNVYTQYPFTVISRLPLANARPLAATDDIAISMVEIDTEGRLDRPLIMYMVDLPSNPRIPRAAVAAEARRLLDAAGAPPPDIALGDFNMTRGSVSLRTILPGLSEAFEEAGHGYGASFHRAFPLYHIDHILFGKAVRALRYDLIDPGAGRHMAQAADLVPSVASTGSRDAKP